MDAFMLPDQSISVYNRSNNHKTHVDGFAYRRISGNIAHGSLLNIHGSLFGVPPSLSSSFSSFSSHKQPPLLPLPSAKIPALPSPSPLARNRKTNKKKDHGPKKAKLISANLKKESSRLMIKDFSTTDRLRPDPSDIPKEAPGVMKYSSQKVSSVDKFDEQVFCSIFSLSPPPSSLPLPKFSLRPKRRCNTED